MDCKAIVFDGYVNPSSWNNLKDYFIRQYKNAQKNENYSINEFFDECIEEVVVIEDVFQSQNASAVLRSCDCFGIQDVHIIENRNEYDINPLVALGSTKWLTMQKYNEKTYNTVDCINSLKEKGYTIVATSPHEEDILLDELPLDKPIALMFGTEAEGLTDKALEMADIHMKNPHVWFYRKL